MEKKFLVGPSPHIRTKETVETVMLDVVIALTPALILSLIYFGKSAGMVILVSVMSALISEAVCQKIMNKELEIKDFSAVITGILFAFVVPPTLPLWMAGLGASVSIIIGKMVFGGLGHNIFNPALIGRSFLLASWPVAMTTWIYPRGTSVGIDGKAGATVLGILKMTNYNYDSLFSTYANKIDLYKDLFLGNVGGSLGETSALAILLGGLYLLYRKQITWHIPISYIGTVFFLTLIFGHNPVFHILSGGLFLGAFFMATDMVTSPYTPKGKLIFGIGAGILVVWIRLKGGYPEGVCYSILIMNAVTPLLNKYTRPKVFGKAGKK